MPGREWRRGRRLITVIAAVAAAGMVTGLHVPYAMATQATALTPAAATTRAGGSALIGARADQLNGVACRSVRDCLAVGANYHAGMPLAESWNGTRWRAVSVKLPSRASSALLDGVVCPAAAGTYCVAPPRSVASARLAAAGANACRRPRRIEALDERHARQTSAEKIIRQM